MTIIFVTFCGNG